ncbi:MAG: serine--tRNA ligase [Solirubrobacteraceae bacterium]|nr:serine--tRNA ligase [Solirubrobacteraceae bacterium]
MLDLRRLRSEPEVVRAALERRDGAEGLDRVIELDEQRRALLPQLEALRAEQNAANEAISAAKASGESADQQIAAMKDVAARAKALDAELQIAEAELDGALALLPNLPDDDAPAEDTVLRECGEQPKFDFEPRDHLDLSGERIDMERAARLSGARFAYLRGELVMLELALVRWTLELLGEHGFEPVIPPVLVREEALHGTGFLPDTEQQIYRLADDDLYLVGTSEVALASLHAHEILVAEKLPLRYAGFSPCFRREAGSAGRDTRGIFRVHQFDKVEMFSFAAPEEAKEEHLRLLAIEEQILTALGLPYRVVDIAIDDLGASAARKFDCEAWLPSEGRYRELTSTSNTTDFQARRLAIRMRREGGKPELLATLNGTAVAVGRTIIALLENGQQSDGSVVIPQCLVDCGAPAVLPPAEA